MKTTLIKSTARTIGYTGKTGTTKVNVVKLPGISRQAAMSRLRRLGLGGMSDKGDGTWISSEGRFARVGTFKNNGAFRPSIPFWKDLTCGKMQQKALAYISRKIGEQVFSPRTKENHAAYYDVIGGGTASKYNIPNWVVAIASGKGVAGPRKNLP